MSVKEFVFAQRPIGKPDESVFRLQSTVLPSLREGEVRLKPLFFSVDPYMRGRMNEGKSYVPGFELNQPIQGGCIAQVVESEHATLKNGDLVSGMLPWATEIVSASAGLQKVSPDVASVSIYLGALGMTGLTAYFGLLDIGKPRAGETVVVSGAAGAVGMVVGQIAKIQKCRVVGIAGSDKKAALLKEKFGFDEVINYKGQTPVLEALKGVCPKGIDVYFDNVGGEISDAVMSLMNTHGRIALCGQISLYNAKEIPTGPRLQPLVLTRSLLVQGFIVNNYQSRFAEGFAALFKWHKDGLLESAETVVEGFETLPKAFLGLFSGENTGKMIVKVN